MVTGVIILIGRVLYLHREKLRRYLNLTEEQMRDYEVHHINGDKDNNDISNLKLVTKKEHHQIHDRRSETSKRHVCKKCGRTYRAYESESIFYCNNCNEI